MPKPEDRRPYRLMSEGDEEQVTVHPETGVRVTWRHVGFIGHSGAFYSRDEDPADYEDDGYRGLWAIAHTEDLGSEEIDFLGRQESS